MMEEGDARSSDVESGDMLEGLIPRAKGGAAAKNMQKKNEKSAPQAKTQELYCHRTAGHQRLRTSLAVVVYRDGQLYCICTKP